MESFEQTFIENYKMLNAEQKEAVDTIEGPVLVIAGPGTGKTQLLSTRIANILRKTDADASNILAMTFTEAGAFNMRERLTRFIGKDAYKIGIYTYHAFANEIIQNNCEYFLDRNLNNLADDLTLHKIFTEIHDEIPTKFGLRAVKISSIQAAINELKQAMISPTELREAAKQNQRLDFRIIEELKKINFEEIKRKQKEEIIRPFYERILGIFAEILKDEKIIASKIKPNLFYSFESLKEILETPMEKFSSKPFTAWKNENLDKRSENGEILPHDFRNNKIIGELADFYEKYLSKMRELELFDYTDMILEVIRALERYDDLRLTLQEKYQYILLDEYQDTNSSQSRIVELLTDNPLSEGRPNVLAVGDDDQAIYAFQGAKSSNMLDFYNRYRDTKLINLTKNYRSKAEILEAAHNIAVQIGDRLSDSISINGTKLEKNITAEGKISGETLVLRKDFKSQIAEYSWVADEISRLISDGIEPSEIAVLAPKHKFLQDFAPFLKNREIPVFYEKKENIFEDKIVNSLVKISRLIIAIKDKNENKMNELFPEVLSFDFWKNNPIDIWKMSWAANSKREFWLTEMLSGEENANKESNKSNLKKVAQFLISLAEKIDENPLEIMLDVLLGNEKWDLSLGEIAKNDSENTFESPIRSLFRADSDEKYFDTLSNLTVLREYLRNYTSEQNNSLRDLAEFAEAYENAQIKIINTNPHRATDMAVQLMTPFSAKGLEFSHVFLLSVHDSLWNGASGGSQKITMPKNLEFVNIKDGGEDTKLRLFFVAITRAKTNLYMTNFLRNFSGTKNKRLEFLAEVEEKKDGENVVFAKNLPEKFANIENDEREAEEFSKDFETNWHGFYKVKTEKMADLLASKLKKYQISPTHVNSFLDKTYGGPTKFFENTILRFPQSYSPSNASGTIVHNIISRAQNFINNTGDFDEKNLLSQIPEMAKKYGFSEKDTAKIIDEAEKSVKFAFDNRRELLQKGNKAEENFSSAGVFLGNAHLTGNIDLIKIDQNSKEITVIDWKTGKIPLNNKDATKLDSQSSKIYKYEQQLYFYKILIENSGKFDGFNVKNGVLEFIEPNENNRGFSYKIDFEPNREEFLKIVIQGIFERVQRFEFDDEEIKTESEIKAIKEFENKIAMEFARRHGWNEVLQWQFGARGSFLQKVEVLG